MEKIFRERLDFDVKIRLIGALCTAVCIVLRMAYFPQTAVNVLVMLIPLFLAEAMGFARVMFASLEGFSDVTSDDEEKDEKEYDRLLTVYERVCEKFRSERAKLFLTARFIKWADILTAVFIALYELGS